MPLPTFTKLPKAKQNHFLAMALKEFADHDYEQASISNLVRALGIAKGSVYQYFNNKWDLYLYLVAKAHGKLLEIMRFVDARATEPDLNIWFVQRIMAEIRFAVEFNHEFELLTKTRSDRSTRIAPVAEKLMLEEKQLIKTTIQSIDNLQVNADDLAFMIYAIKDNYIRTLQNPIKTNDDIMDQLSSFASIIFKEAE